MNTTGISRIAASWTSVPATLLIAATFLHIAAVAPTASLPILAASVLVVALGVTGATVVRLSRPIADAIRPPAFDIATVAVLHDADPDSAGHVRARAPSYAAA